jgi:hypothetical protein
MMPGKKFSLTIAYAALEVACEFLAAECPDEWRAVNDEREYLLAFLDNADLAKAEMLKGAMYRGSVQMMIDKIKENA